VFCKVCVRFNFLASPLHEKEMTESLAFHIGKEKEMLHLSGC